MRAVERAWLEQHLGRWSLSEVGPGGVVDLFSRSNVCWWEPMVLQLDRACARENGELDVSGCRWVHERPAACWYRCTSHHHPSWSCRESYTVQESHPSWSCRKSYSVQEFPNHQTCPLLLT